MAINLSIQIGKSVLSKIAEAILDVKRLAR